MDRANNFLKDKKYTAAVNEYKNILEKIDVSDYIIDTNISNRIIAKEDLKVLLINLGSLYKAYFEEIIKTSNASTLYSEQLFLKSVECFLLLNTIDYKNESSQTQLVSIYTQICNFYKDDYNKCCKYLLEIKNLYPCNEVINYNLGHIYQKLNKQNESIVHYKLCLELAKSRDIKINAYNGLGCIYRTNKLWIESLYYLNECLKISPLDPDINNQLGIVYTELRNTKKAIVCYKIALDNYKDSIVTSNVDTVHSDIYLNMGHMYSYNGDNHSSVDVYNKALLINPLYRLPFQNKLMNLLYIKNDIEDPMYITRQHKFINKLINAEVKLTREIEVGKPLNIGLVSGDFKDHPVSYFIKALVNRLNVKCYSQEPGIHTVIRNMTGLECAKMIVNDKIDVLIDLSGHTANNRLDIFAYKPAPIQISYCGYPFTTGLEAMDYRITDEICDNVDISKPYYTEKLLFMKDCFLCYQNDNYPELENASSGKLRIGCFNRLNKISTEMFTLFNDILKRVPNSVLVFKTKALLNMDTSNKFLENFKKEYHSRITILNCTISHYQHLAEYNKIDIAIDTFPYSGTTTSCESLLMGVPVLTLYDNKGYYHPQNVTTSLLINSNLKEYVCYTQKEIIDKIADFELPNRESIRSKFLSGKVCDTNRFLNNFEELINSLIARVPSS